MLPCRIFGPFQNGVELFMFSCQRTTMFVLDLIFLWQTQFRTNNGSLGAMFVCSKIQLLSMYSWAKSNFSGTRKSKKDVQGLIRGWCSINVVTLTSVLMVSQRKYTIVMYSLNCWDIIMWVDTMYHPIQINQVYGSGI